MIACTSDPTALQHDILPKANRLDICDLPDDVLILVLSSLHPQDVARCILVCRRFSDLIHGDLSLQYDIELAINGMVDGYHNILPVSERLHRLRQYSSDFSSGAFHRQDLTAHPDYLREERDLLGWPRRVIHPTKPSGAIFTKVDQGDSSLYLSHFVPGCALAGIPSSRSLFSVRDGVKPDLALKGWAVDDAQDLFVMVEMIRTRMPTNVTPDVYIRFYSLSGLKADTVPPTPHAAATLPVILLHAFDGTAKAINVFQPQILGPHLILEIHVDMGARKLSYFIDVYNWKTGEIVSRTNIGKLFVAIVPLDERYLLVFPSARTPERHPDLRIYRVSFAPSPLASSQPSRAQVRVPDDSRSSPEAIAVAAPGRHVCTLQLPPAPPGERVAWSQAKSSDRPSEESAGHFRADPARSLVCLYIHYEGVERKGQGEFRGENQDEDEDEDEDGDEDEDDEEVVYAYAMHLLVPRATLAAQIQAAESASTSRQASGDAGAEETRAPSQSEPRTIPLALEVPWVDWGPRGTLRLYQRGALFDSEHIVVPAPFGSRLPFVVPDSSSDSSDSQNDSGGVPGGRVSTGTGSVYVFDVNPLVPRSALRVPRDRGAMTAVVDAGGIEKVLPGVVDPECAAIPYVVYRFPLPYPDPPSTDGGMPGSPVGPPEIRAVTMSMAGFTVQFDDGVEYEKRFQTCTV